MELLSKLFARVRSNSNQENFELSVTEKAELDEMASESSLQENYSTSMNGNGELVHWSPSLQSLLDEPPSSLPQQLVFGGIAFCLAIITWSWFGQVEEIGKARGKLIPNGETYKVEPVELGRVSQINVKEGDRVKAGEILVKLDDELVTKEADSLKQMLAAYQIELRQMQTLLERVRSQARTDEKIAEAESLGYQSTLALAREKVAISRQLLTQRQTEIAAHQTKQTQLKPISGLMQERLKQLKLEEAVHQKRLERLRPLERQGAISQEFIFEAEQGQRQIQQQLIQSKLQETTNTREQLFEAEQSLRELQVGITQNRGELTSALKEVERLEAELRQKLAERQKIQLEAKQKIEQSEVEITQIETKIAETKNQLSSVKTKLEQNYLKSPINGTILSLDVQNSGKVIQAGQTVAEIAPYGEPLVLSTVIPNKEAGFVEVGMPVQVKFDAYSYQDYGVVPGKVISISGDSKSNEQKDEVYGVKVALQRNYITADGKEIKFKPGQTAVADIVIRRRRLLDVFLEPIKQIEKDGIDL
ncbi:MAG TPA: HlyD family efflux transporter periplasmic adaptor subunit [Coleofasciculaceae cyanobacterium]|jgi:HlyD family secretion protein